jgi:hypothetical protein
VRDDSHERRWKLGGRFSESNKHQLSYVRDLSQSEVDDLRKKFKFVWELADQDRFARILESGNRWGRILDAGARELEADQRVSNLTQRSAALELVAFVRLGERMARELATEARELAQTPEPQRTRFEQTYERLCSAGLYSQLLEIADRDGFPASPLLRVRKAVDPFYLGGLEAYGARDLVDKAVFEFGRLLADYLLLSRSVLRAISTALRSYIDAVSTGMPSLIHPPIKAVGEPSRCEFVDFPVFALAGLEGVFEEISRGRAEEGILHLIRSRSRRTVRFGTGSADSAVSGGPSSEGLDAVPSAKMKIDVDLLGSEPIDYWAPLRETIEEGGYRQEMFSGSVAQARVNDRLVELQCEGALTVFEQVSGGTLAANMDQAELLRALTARSDWDGDLKLSEAPKEGRPESFDVLVPLVGVTVEEPVEVGGVTIVPRGEGLKRISIFDSGSPDEKGEELLAEFRDASSYALVTAQARMPNEAEDAGLDLIETAIAWLTVRGRYGAVTLPGGNPQDFDRRQSLRGPERGPVVFVIGAETKRLWLRRPAGPAAPVERELIGDASALGPTLPAELEANDRLALLALSLASSAIDPLIQVQALWQAIESYAERRKGERKLFTKREKLEIGEGIPDGLNKRQRKRLKEAIKALNQEPLALRLQRRLKQDAVSITEDELALLDKLRKARNDVVHGRQVEQAPKRDEINYGISIVARMLVHRVAALQGEAAADR